MGSLGMGRASWVFSFITQLHGRKKNGGISVSTHTPSWTMDFNKQSYCLHDKSLLFFFFERRVVIYYGPFLYKYITILFLH